MNNTGVYQGGRHGQAISGQDSRVWNDTFQTPRDLPQEKPGDVVYRPSSETTQVSSAGQDDGRWEEDETQAPHAQSQIPVAPYTRNAYAGTLPEGTCRDMNWHNFALSSHGEAYTNNTTNSSRGMTGPTLRSDNDNGVFLASPYAHDLSVYELQRFVETRSDIQELLDQYDEIQATDTLLIDPIFPEASSSRSNGPSPPQNTAPTPSKSKISEDWKPHACIVKNCSRGGKPFARRQDYMRHISTSNDSAHARLRAAISR